MVVRSARRVRLREGDHPPPLGIGQQGRYRLVNARPRRSTLPITVGRLQVNEDGVVGEIIELPVL